MNLRTILIFPEFENIAIIDQLREKYDPLAKLIRSHITIVFPFEIELQGFSKCVDKFGNYLFLDVIKGGDEIIKIHNLLYDNEFHKFDAGLAYLPHLTVGKLKDTFELEFIALFAQS